MACCAPLMSNILVIWNPLALCDNSNGGHPPNFDCPRKWVCVKHASTGMGRRQGSTCQQRDNCPTLNKKNTFS